jgi:branched-chain amino acid transport system permease protein
MAPAEPVRLGTLGIALVIIFIAPGLVSASTVRILQLAALLGLVALGLNLALGYGGQFAISHVFFYGLGSYTVGILAIRAVTTNALVLILAAVVAAVVAALITGVPGLRLGAWSLGMVSFFLITLVPDFVQFFPNLTGGTNGLIGIPQLTLFGTELSTNGMYRFTIAMLSVWLIFQRRFIYSGYGRILAVLREDTIQLSSLGVSPYRMKLFVYVLSAIPAGAAAVVFSTLDGVVSPDSFSLNITILVLAGVIFGGKKTMYGGLLGALILVWIQQDLLALETYMLLAFGCFLVLVAVLLPNGVGGTVLKLFGGLRKSNLLDPKSSVETAARLGPVETKDLAVRGVAKRFGGVQALSDVSIDVTAGEITALIGPNGSGKTTLLNAISGFARSDVGSLLLGDSELYGRSAATIARVGVGRTFQTPRLPSDLTVRETIATAGFSHKKAGLVSTILGLPRWRHEEVQLAKRVDGVLRALALDDDAHSLVGSMPLGKKRLVEIARAILMQPALLLLDEAASGLSPLEIDHLTPLLRRLADEGVAILIVEHNMDLVFSAADTVYVLAAGRLLASGTPVEVASNQEVVATYLGEELDRPNAALI